MTYCDSPEKPQTGLRCALALMMLLILFAVAGCGVQATSGSAATGSASSSRAAVPLPAGYFGMIVQNDANSPSIAYGSQRLCGADVAWPAVEPERGVFDFSVLDARVAVAEARGASILLTLGPTPAWAGNTSLGTTAAPSGIADWDAYANAVVSRYKGRIAAYELWGEADSPNYWSGTVAQMAVLSAHAYATIKTLDPTALVVSPSGSAAWLGQYLDAGGTTAIDVVSSHLSPAPAPPEAQAQLVAALRTTMNTHGASSKPLWNTENGWSLVGDLTADEAGGYVARALILNWSNGVDRVYWDSWDGQSGDSLPLTDANAQPNASAGAYAMMEQWLSGAVMNGCATDTASTWTCQISRGGATAWILWNTSGAASSSSLGAGSLSDLSGNRRDLTGISTISIGVKPVLLQ